MNLSSLRYRCSALPTELPSKLGAGHLQHVILDLGFMKTRLGESHGYCDVVVFEKFPFQNAFRPHKNEKSAFSNSFDLKSVFEKAPFS